MRILLIVTAFVVALSACTEPPAEPEAGAEAPAPAAEPAIPTNTEEMIAFAILTRPGFEKTR